MNKITAVIAVTFWKSTQNQQCELDRSASIHDLSSNFVNSGSKLSYIDVLLSIVLLFSMNGCSKSDRLSGGKLK